MGSESDARIPDNQTPPARVLIVGNYCHDVLLQNGAVVAETLGGAASFISNILSALSISCHLTSKVGPNFKYPVMYDPVVVSTSRTTVFHAYFDQGFAGNAHQDRVLKRVEACDPIRAADLPDARFDFGMAVGVGGEILPETLEKMVSICDIVFVDVQALIREFGRDDGKVRLVRLKQSGFYHLLPRIGFLKASSEEALFMDVEEVRRWCCVVVTQGRDGCKVCWKGGEVSVAPFLANQVDPTGAGDSFLGGFAAGLVQGLSVPDAALLGNFFGSLTVGQIGLPSLDSRLLLRIKDELQIRSTESSCCSNRKDNNVLKFVKPSGHEEFYASLGAAKLNVMFQESPRSPSRLDQKIESQCTDLPKSSLNPAEDGAIQAVQGQYRYDVEKAVDALLVLSDSASKHSRNAIGREDIGRRIEFPENFADKDSDCASHLSDLEVQDGFWSTSNGPSPSSFVSDLPQKVLESLFNISKSSEHEPSTMNWRSVVKKMQSLGPMVDVSPSGVEERQQYSYAKGDEYQVFRKASKEHWNSMRTCYEKATAAYSKGDRAYASYLSDQGKVQTKLARAADERASYDIFKARNKSFGNMITIDLHGQHVKQAMKLFKLHLLLGTYVPSVRGLRVITGCGTHGVGKSKLKQSVVKLLEKEGIKWSEENQGTLLVKIDEYMEFNFLDSESDAE